MGALTLPPPSPALVLFGRDHAGKPHASWFDAPSAELATKAAGLMSMRAVPVESDELRELATSLPRGRLFSSGRAFTPFVKGKLYERLVELTRDVLGLETAVAAASDEPAIEPDTVATEPELPVQAIDADEGDAAPSTAAAPPAEEAVALTDAPVAASDPAGTPSAAKIAGPITAAKTAAKPAAAPPTKVSARPSRLEEIGPGSLVLATTGAAEGWYESRVIGVNGSTFTLKWVDYSEPSIVRRGNELGFLPRPPA